MEIPSHLKVEMNMLCYLSRKTNLGLNRAFSIRMSIFPVNKNVSIRELRMYNIQRIEWYINSN